MDLTLYGAFMIGALVTTEALFGVLGPVLLAIAGAVIYLRAQRKAKTAESWEATARAAAATSEAWKSELEAQRLRAERLVGLVEKANEAQRLAVEKLADVERTVDTGPIIAELSLAIERAAQERDRKEGERHAEVTALLRAILNR